MNIVKDILQCGLAIRTGQSHGCRPFFFPVFSNSSKVHSATFKLKNHLRQTHYIIEFCSHHPISQTLELTVWTAPRPDSDYPEAANFNTAQSNKLPLSGGKCKKADWDTFAWLTTVAIYTPPKESKGLTKSTPRAANKSIPGAQGQTINQTGLQRYKSLTIADDKQKWNRTHRAT